MNHSRNPKRGYQSSGRSNAPDMSARRSINYRGRSPRPEYGERRRDRSSSPGGFRSRRRSSDSLESRERDFRTRAQPALHTSTSRPTYEYSRLSEATSLATNEFDRRPTIQHSTGNVSHEPSPIRPSTVTNDPRGDQRSENNDVQPSPRAAVTNGNLGMHKSAPVSTTVNKNNTISDQSATMAMSPVLESDSKASIDAMSQVLSQILEEATDLVSLKLQKAAAKKDADKRDNEFKKWEESHDKFPSMKDTQNRSKDFARKTLTSIEIKYAEKDAKVKEMLRFGATRMVLAGLGGVSQDEQKLQAKVESLEKTTQNLQAQLHIQQTMLQEHQTHIEKQRAEREILETDTRKFQADLATLRNSHNDFMSKVTPRIDIAQRNASEVVAELKDLKNSVTKVENDLTKLSTRVPSKLDVALPALSTRIDDLSAKLAGDLKEVPSLLARIDDMSVNIPVNLKVAFSDLCKRFDTLENTCAQERKSDLQNSDDNHKSHSLHARLLKVETQVDDNFGPLTTYVTSVIKQQSALRQDSDMSQSAIESLLGRVTAMENQDHTTSLIELRNEVTASNARLDEFNGRLSNLPSKIALTDFRSKLAFAESATTKVDKLLKETEDLKKRTAVIEKQPYSAQQASAPVDVFRGCEQSAGFEKLLSDAEEQARSNRTTPAELVSSERLELTPGALDEMNVKMMEMNDKMDAVQNQANELETSFRGMEKRTQSSPGLESTHTSATASMSDPEALSRQIKDMVLVMTAANDATMGDLIDALDSKVQQLRKDVDNFSSTFIPLSTGTEIDNKLNGYSEKFDALTQMDFTLSEKVASLTQRETKFDKSISDLSARVSMLTDKDQLHGDVSRQIDGEHNLSAVSQPAQPGAFSNPLNNIDENLHDRVEAVSMGIIQIENRLVNMNTKDMAMRILNQMDSTYPNLRNAETTLDQHGLSLQQMHTRFQGLEANVANLLDSIPAGGVATTKALRDDLNGLTSELSSIKALAREAKDAVDALQKDIDDSVPEKMAELQAELDALKHWRVSLTEAASKSIMPSTLERTSSFSNGTSSNSHRAHSHTNCDPPAPRLKSGEIKGNHRREKGSYPPISARHNGLHRSPPRKRPRVGATVILDDDEDVAWEPNAPVPNLSDDDE